LDFDLNNNINTNVQELYFSPFLPELVNAAKFISFGVEFDQICKGIE